MAIRRTPKWRPSWKATPREAALEGRHVIEPIPADRERAAMYAAGAERHAARLREKARKEWARFHLNMSRLHSELAEEHERKAASLAGEVNA